MTSAEFIERSNYFKALCKPRRFNFRPDRNGSYVKPLIPGEINGKLARKAAKKLRVKARKTAA